MMYYFAPMEGITTSVFRRVHNELFPGADRYYTPFFSPTCDHLFTPRELRELLPEHNIPDKVVPQILTKNAEDFLWAAQGLADMGYTEVNLNLGCPSATVTAKGKGSGMLLQPKQLNSMLSVIFEGSPIDISIKTRIGYHSPEEWPNLLEIYNQYPVKELIVHPRTKIEMYSGSIHADALEYVLQNSRAPVCINGDLFNISDVRASEAKYDKTEQRMFGRGAAADPAFFRKLKGGMPVTEKEIRTFHGTLYEEYCSLLGRQNGMRKMKEIWHYLICLFEDSGDLRKKIARAKTPEQFDECIAKGLCEYRLGLVPANLKE